MRRPSDPSKVHVAATAENVASRIQLDYNNIAFTSAGEYIQEAQLLLGDRATRKHAKDS